MAHCFAHKRGLTRTPRCSLPRSSPLSTSVGLCISKVEPAPPCTRVDSVAFEDTQLNADIDLTPQPVSRSDWKESKTIIFYSFGRSSPHDLHGIFLGGWAPLQKRGRTRTLCHSMSRPASGQPASARYNLHPLPTNGIERYQRGITRWYVSVRHRTSAVYQRGRLR